MRLKRAAELLGGAGSIAEVAFLVGFHEPSYFTKYFQSNSARLLLNMWLPALINEAGLQEATHAIEPKKLFNE